MAEATPRTPAQIAAYDQNRAMLRRAVGKLTTAVGRTPGNERARFEAAAFAAIDWAAEVARDDDAEPAEAMLGPLSALCGELIMQLVDEQGDDRG